MSNAESFLDAYARCERALSRRRKNRTDYMPFANMIRMFAKSDPIVRSHFEELKEYAELRNAIVHQRGGRDEVIAEPNNYVTARFTHIADLLEEDLNVLHYASSPVITARMDDTMEETFQKMHKASSTKLPVYEDGVFRGLITMEEVADWGLHSRNESIRVQDIVRREKGERVLFLARTATLQKVALLFDESRFKEAVSPVILISEHGSSDEEPLGILTSRELRNLIAVLS
jgi:predicted transcriptional regulator